MPTPRVNITESVLVWARKQAGYSPEDAARKLNVKEERYLSWEDANDDLKPTIKQLRKIAKLYKRPVSLFYLPEPPEGFQPMRDLRRLPGDRLGTYSPALRFEMERSQQRREVALDLFQVAGDDLEKFGLKASVRDDPETVGADVRKALGINFSEQKTWRRKGALEPFKAWRRAVEAYGVLVFQMSGVETDEVNGFALAAEVLPIIAVNRGDVPNRRTFSLLHEFSHLLLNLSGVSDLDMDTTRPPEEQRIEVFCNHVAAAALMPKEHVLSAPMVRAHPGKSTDWSDSDIRTVSDQFGVSREAFLRRLANRSLKYELNSLRQNRGGSVGRVCRRHLECAGFFLTQIPFRNTLAFPKACLSCFLACNHLDAGLFRASPVKMRTAYNACHQRRGH